MKVRWRYVPLIPVLFICLVAGGVVLCMVALIYVEEPDE